ncbi:organic cation transporter protein-like [Strongylocentrotus purpuratus]|uniref:Uncharacterized protein n=1 Tax=Strongylocentrotus purpuratus TaxID=7668 RepID=A0A7M7MYD5_STRPU|nr:organic cation transporter protein-like [Strongylocentrotus purpuratus]
MKFDDILKNVGEFGPYQRRVYLISLIFKFTGSWATLLSVFINAPVDHWCATPEWTPGCEQYGFSDEACALAQKEGSIPSNYTSDGELEYAQCEKYNVSGVGFWPGIDPSNYSSETMSCDSGWVYDDSQYKTTTVTEFDLVCGNGELTQVSQSIYYGGFLAGSIFFGILSDVIGRWWTLLLANLVSLVSGVAIVFSPNWWFFATMRFFMGSGSISFNITFWLPESARWLISVGKYDKAEKVITKVAEVNKAELQKPLFTKEFMVEQERIRKEHRPTGLDLIRTPRMRMRTINLVFICTLSPLPSPIPSYVFHGLLFVRMVNSMVYHGLSLNSSNLGTNDYVAFAITGGIEIPAYIMDIFIVEFFGRRLSLFFCLMLGGVACLSTAFIPTGVALTTVSMIGKFGIAGSFAIIYLYTVELYPTNIRGVAMGNCSMFSRVATISAPLVLILAKYWDPLPLVIYGSLSVIASLSALALPETRGKKLPETLEEGEQFGLNDGEKGETTSETVHDNPAFSMEDEK